MNSDSGPGKEMRLIVDEVAEELDPGTLIEFEYFFKLNKKKIMDEDRYDTMYDSMETYLHKKKSIKYYTDGSKYLENCDGNPDKDMLF